MKLYAHYIKLQERMRFHHAMETDLPFNAFTRDVSPTTAALQIIFRQQLVKMGSWRDCMACDENWRKLKVMK